MDADDLKFQFSTCVWIYVSVYVFGCHKNMKLVVQSLFISWKKNSFSDIKCAPIIIRKWNKMWRNDKFHGFLGVLLCLVAYIHVSFHGNSAVPLSSKHSFLSVHSFCITTSAHQVVSLAILCTLHHLVLVSLTTIYSLSLWNLVKNAIWVGWAHKFS